MAGDASPAPLPPIIKRSTSPSHAAVSNSALRSPVFADGPPSPGVLAAPTAAGQQQQQQSQAQQGGYFSPQPSSILLNKGEGSSSAGVAPRSSTSRDRNDDVSDRTSPGLHLHAPEARSPSGVSPGTVASSGLLRIASPDGSAASDGGFSSDGGGPASTVPSTVGSPAGTTTFAKPTLSTLYTGGGAAVAGSPGSQAAQADEAAQAALRRASSPPSPHCHFAPLPKPEERPTTRRNSTANRVKPFVPPPRVSAESSAAVDDDEHLHSPLGTYHPGDSSIPSASALSQRLSSSLTFADGRSPTHSPYPSHASSHGHGSASPSRPTSRRSSSSRRSRSPSPHAARFRPSTHPTQSAGVSSRTHSPNLSRHTSTDALSLHYIEAAGEVAAVARERHAISRTSSRAGSERGGGAGVEWQVGGGEEGGAFGQATTGGQPGSRRTSTDRGQSLSRTGSSAGFVDRDKEADLHRLADKAALGNVDAERAVSPALAAQAKRERSASRGAQGGDGREEPRATVIGRRGENEEVVEVGPGEDKDEGELEEVLEEPEEEEGDEEAQDDDEDEDEEEEEEDDGQAERSRDEDDDEDDDDEEPQEERKTSKGAAVEVVRWHRPERDQERDQQPTPALRGASPSPGRATPTDAGGTLLAPPVPSPTAP